MQNNSHHARIRDTHYDTARQPLNSMPGLGAVPGPDLDAPATPEVPGTWDWDALPAGEYERRQEILADIRRRVAEQDPHHAEPDPQRARQFMPFAALTGYKEMVSQVVDDLMSKPDFAGTDPFDVP